jgi:hypothetical protein
VRPRLRPLLRRLLDGQRLAVDADDAILHEYIKALRVCGSPNLASKLAERLFRLRYNDDVCHRVATTPIAHPPSSYAEVPAPLRDFDNDDQKFIAVAAAEGSLPPIFAALDGEWWDRRVDFAAVGLDVQFLCAADLIAGADRR